MSFQVRLVPGPAKTTPVEWVISRSTDGGRHWSKPEPPQATWPEDIAKVDREGFLFVTADNRLMFQIIPEEVRVVSGQGTRIYVAESRDDGHTWGEVRRAGMTGGWPKDPGKLYHPYGPIVLLKDGTLLRTFF